MNNPTDKHTEKPADQPLVLIVDDNPDHRAIAAALLKSIGCLAFESETTWIAETFLATNRPDLVLVDLHMPLKSGIQLLKDIAPARKAHPFPVVIYSSFAEQYEKELKGLDVTAVIDKSDEPEQFIATVKKVLASHFALSETTPSDGMSAMNEQRIRMPPKR